jgi:hypothetical protein
MAADSIHIFFWICIRALYHLIQIVTGGQGYESTNQTNHYDAQVQNTMTLLIQSNWLLAIVHPIPDVAQG